MMPTTSQELDTGFIKPRLRVFLSVDLIGSTQFKIQQNHRKNEKFEPGDPNWWPNMLMAFYTDFQKEFLRNWQEWGDLAADRPEVVAGDPPKLWKALGDELIFSKTCNHANEIWGVVQVWRKTISDFKKTWAYDQLKFKSGAWLVGSPFRNYEIAFLREAATEEEMSIMGDRQGYNFYLLQQYYCDSERKIDIDFVGSSMDCGFRLLSKADERKFVISADLAQILMATEQTFKFKFKNVNYPEIKYYFDGVQELKGIARYGVNYPIIWLDSYQLEADGDIAKYARSLDKLSKTRPVDWADFRDFLTTFLSEIEGFPEVPYILNGDYKFEKCPDDHLEKIKNFRGVYTQAVERLASLKRNAKDLGDSGAPPTDDQETAIGEVSIDPPTAS
jgi:hypothetical protein